MKEIVCVRLENDMDLILAHKRAMKLCELTGFSLIIQTSIATAISEIARSAIEYGENAELRLFIEARLGKKFLAAVVRDTTDFSPRSAEAIQYAKRLVDDIEVLASAKEFQVILRQQLCFPHTLTEAKLKSFVEYFRSEPPLSPYDEMRKKNLLLQELAEKIKESENDFRILTDSLPLMIFSINSRNIITYSNKWLQDYLGATPKDAGHTHWQSFLHPSDYSSFSKDLSNAMSLQVALNGEYRFLQKGTGKFLWHIFSLIPLKNEKDILIRWIGFIVDINAQKEIGQALKDNRELKETQKRLFENQAELQDKIIELNRSNYELEQFAHLASHDLQEPLRKLFFYTDVMKKKYQGQIDDAGMIMLNNMASAAGRMKELITDLLSYSQLQKQELKFEPVDLNSVIEELIRDLDITIKENRAIVEVDRLPVILGNRVRLSQLFLNLIGNALKYSKKGVPPHIQIMGSIMGDKVSVKVKDYGIGFEDKYKEKIFGLFERLHSRNEFPGTGIGLSICRKIAELHRATISANSIPGNFSEFEVTFPVADGTKLVAI